MADKKDALTQDKPVSYPPSIQPRGAAPIFDQANFIPGAIKQRHLVPQPTRKGDLYFGKDGNSFTNIPIGTNGQLLQVVNGMPAWGNTYTTGVATARPTSGTYVGQYFFSTDTFVLSIWTGLTWKSVTLT